MRPKTDPHDRGIKIERAKDFLAKGHKVQFTVFCRGRQITDSEGWGEFHTIYPGWYTPRSVHIHVKALLNKKEMITTQLYFPQDLNDTILSTESPYETRGKSPYRNDGDIVLRRSRGDNVAWPKVVRSDGAVLAKQTLVVKKTV